MTQPVDLDRLLTSWLVDDAPSREPEGLLARSLLHVRRTRRQPGWLAVVRGTAMGTDAVSARLAPALVLVGLLVIALATGIAIGSAGPTPPVVPAVPPPTPTPTPTWGSSLPPVAGLPGRFAFASDRDGDFDIYAMQPDRTDLRQLTNSAGDDVSPLWSPDGSRIAFMSSRGGDPAIYVMNADGTGATLLVDEAGEDLLGTWSPDGTEIAYTDQDSAVHIIDVDSRVDRLVTVQYGPAAAYGLSVYGWMPDGADLLVVLDRSTDGGELDIYRVRIADGRTTPLTTGGGDDGTPAVSPDGSKIAFESDRGGGCLFVMDADGSDPTRLTSRCSKGFPKTWAPDGTWIGWAGARRPDHDQPWDISVIHPDGTGRTELTDSGDVVDLAWGRSP